MKKFILLGLLYTSIPILGGILNSVFLQVDQGDLVRLGKLYRNDLPREKLDLQRNRKYKTLNELNLNQENDFDILTIGDSFSEFGNGYQNGLIERGYKVVNFEHKLTSNPIQELIDIVNSDLLDRINIDFIVLESIQRDFNERCSQLEFNRSVNIDSLYKTNWTQRKTKKVSYANEFFSIGTITAPFVNLAYLFLSKPPMFSDTYKLDLTSSNLFSSKVSDLLVYKDDILKMKSKNSVIETKRSVESLNLISRLLTQKGIKLVVMIAPDKYDLFYNKIAKKHQIVEPQFFTEYKNLSKNYFDVSLYSEFVLAMNNNVQDIYFYDDSHWSPIGQEIAADLIVKCINSH